MVTVAAPTAEGRPATGGVGTFGGAIDWVEWGTPSQLLPTTGFTGTTTRTVSGAEVVITCQASNIAGGSLEAYRPGTWGGDAMDDMYNINGTGTANQLVNALSNRRPTSTISFDFSCSATADGAPIALAGLVFGDAEQSGNGEYVAATAPAGSTYRIIDRFRTEGCTTSTVATLTSATNRLLLAGTDPACSTGPAAVAFIEGATSARVELRGAGKSAIALGAVIAVDFGDAPESYGSSGHLVDYTFTGGEVPEDTPTSIHDPSFTLGTASTQAPLGENVDPEGAPTFSADALGDDTNSSGAFGTAGDEDGLLSGTSIAGAVGAPYTARVACAATGDPVAGWIDWNLDGDFDDAGERSQTGTCAGSGADTTITWPSVPQDLVGQLAGSSTYLRIRTAEDPAEIASPASLALTGEAEDYAVTLDIAPSLQVTKEVVERADAADQFTVSIQTVDGTSVADATTSGTDTSATTGARIVQDAVTYQVTEVMDAGPTPLASYNATITCRDTVNDTDVAVTGDRPPWTLPPLTSPSAVECTVSNAPFEPAISLEKTATLIDADGDDLADVGESVRYDFVVTNTGDATLTDVSVDDPTVGEVTCVDTTLAAGEETTCTATVIRPVTQEDVDAGEPLTNTATATATGPAGEPVESEPDTATVVPDGQVSLVLEKTATLEDPNGNEAADAGESITYDFTVTNDGQRTLSDIAVSDPTLGEVTCTPTTLGAGAVATCTATAARAVTQDDVDAGEPLTNTATATGTGSDGTEASDDDDASVPIAPAAPALVLEKSGALSGDEVIAPGDTIDYSFEVTNTGNVTVTDVGVEDALLQDAGDEVTCVATSLAPGEATTCTAAYEVTAADSARGSVSNTASAVALSPAEEVVSSEEDTVVVEGTPPMTPRPAPPRPILAATGAALPWLAPLGGLLTLAGALMVARRRPTEEG